MRASVSDRMASYPFTAEAAKIVRSCVHCGFCNATCPTYQLTGDELEGPRGRIYLIKSLLEGGRVGNDTRRHLDQCLQCRNCETTCPSGVRYGALLELVRPHIARVTALPWTAKLKRTLLVLIVPHRRSFAALLGLGRIFRPVLPRRIARLIPPRPTRSPRVVRVHSKKILLLDGCAQPALNPNIDASAALVFDRLGISLVSVPGAGCCGALALHLGYEERAVQQAKANLDAWWAHIESGADAIMATSSGCGVHLKDYARLLAAEPDYCERAKRLQGLVRDPIELIGAEQLMPHVAVKNPQPLAFQAPCTLQHGQRLSGKVENLLTQIGWKLVAVNEAHLCCGSAGSYSVLHGDTAAQLRMRKLENLMHRQPAAIITANIGCQSHLGVSATVPVRHWLELVADNLVER